MSHTNPPNALELPIDQLDAHPANSNVMPAALIDKLAGQIGRSGRYPPVIVRPIGDRYQILDGHHRVAVLRKLGHACVQCVLWPVDDDEALLLLATLNRLRGDDDPRKRAALLSKLRESMEITDLARRLPEDAEKVRKLLAIHAAPPSPQTPRPVDDLPVCLNFFLLPDQRREVERVLAEHGGSREQALLALLGLNAGVIDE